MKYTAIRSEGGLIPYDLLEQIANEQVPGQKPADFGLSKDRRLSDEIQRVWSDAQDFWDVFRRRMASPSERDPYGTTETRERWLYPLLGDPQTFAYELKLQPSAIAIDGASFSISHLAGTSPESPPVHIEGFKVDLDQRRPNLRTSPRAMVQEFLNRSEPHIWGVLTNGLRFLLLRDSVRTARPTYLEFDLQTILEGNHFHEFALFYRLCHRSRLPRPGEDPTKCLLEQYYLLSIEQGGRVREKLRVGVEEALKIFGTGFMRHPANTELREKIASGRLKADEYHRQLLRLVYRLLFLMVAEERRLIAAIGEDAERRQRIYDDFYSVARLRERAEDIVEEGIFADLWIGLKLTFSLFSDTRDQNPLGIPPLNGELFSYRAIPDLERTELYNHDLLRAIRRLSLFREDKVLHRVNYSALDVEELGSVYESLLDFQPLVAKEPEGPKFELHEGGERKSTGSYYTRPELVRELIQSALVPVIEDRLAEAEKVVKGKPEDEVKATKEKAILGISVCDPACGSGHFLLEAGRRLGRELARIRTGQDEPAPGEFHLAVRDAISHCVYGVDLNPLAVDLCKLALWLEGHWIGKPLSFLDHRIKCGNSLIGVLDPTVLEKGIPDEAFSPVTGDDKRVAAAFKKRNRNERAAPSLSQRRIDFEVVVDEHLREYVGLAQQLEGVAENRPEDVKRKASLYEQSRANVHWFRDSQLANVWTGAFFVPLVTHNDPAVPTCETFLEFVSGRVHQPQFVPATEALAGQFRFFHWFLEFPEVFAKGGFDAVLGNPPWERTALEELEFFALRSPEVLSAPTTALRKKAIQSLSKEKPSLFAEYAREKRRADCENKYFNESGLYPLGAQGRLNTYALFANLGLNIVACRGRIGMVLQSGLATDAPMEDFWRHLIRDRRLVSFIDFENKKRIFPDVHPEQKFALVSITGDARPRDAFATVGFWLQDIAELNDPQKVYDLAIDELERFSPNTGQPLLTRRRSDLDVLHRIYSSSDVCWHSQRGSGRARAWVAMTSASFSEFFRREADLTGASQSEGWELSVTGTTYSPLLEAKQIEQYDFSYATYAGVTEQEIAAGYPREITHADGDLLDIPKPRYWADKAVVDEFLSAKNDGRGWCLVYRDVTNVNNERTTIAVVIPAVGFIQPLNGITCPNARAAAVVLAAVNSLVCDFVARFRFTGRHLNVTTFSQLPIPTWIDESFVVPRAVELAYTGICLKPFAEECGYSGAPFSWNSKRRALLRCELDAAFAHFYGLSADELAYILNTFAVLQSREEREFGTFRTRDAVLELFASVKELVVRDPSHLSGAKLDVVRNADRTFQA